MFYVPTDGRYKFVRPSSTSWINFKAGDQVACEDDETVENASNGIKWDKNSLQMAPQGSITTAPNVIVNNSGIVATRTGMYNYFDNEHTLVNRDAMMMYDDPVAKNGPLKCKCYVCEKEIKPYQNYHYGKCKYEVTMKCCGREETVLLSEEQIKLNNETGFYFAFMGIN